MIPLLIALHQSPTLDLHLMPSGVFDRVHGYAPFALKLSKERPARLTKAPAATNPAYGTVKIGTHEYLAMLDGNRLYVDSNGDGDLTDDPATVWAQKTYANGSKGWEGSATIDLPYGGTTTPCRIGFYSTDRPNELGYYADFALAGKATLGGKAYEALYSDPSASWDGKQGILMIDKDGDGKFHPGYEFYRANEPFNVGGTTYEMRGLGLVRSAKTVAERTAANAQVADPNLANGLRQRSLARAFHATTLGGRPVSFPTTYKGKLVLLDFWATWCHPCMREVPNVVRAFRAYHAKGFEVLGVSLDRAGAAKQVRTVAAKNGMTWGQIYDGKFFDAAVAKRYGIQAVPESYLVDGDTGRILAFGADISGKKLAPAIEKALESKAHA